jgi:DNA-binding CsgD family transcriptional regulator
MTTSEPWDAAIRAAQDDLARAWLLAIAPVCPRAAPRRLIALLEKVIEALREHDPADGRVRGAGAALARLARNRIEALNRALTALARGLAGAVPTEYAAALHPRLLAASGELARGFMTAPGAGPRSHDATGDDVAALLRRVGRVETCLGSLPELVCLLDATGTVRLMTGAGVASFPVPRRLLTGYPIQELVAGLPELPDDARRALAGEVVVGERLIGVLVYHLGWGPLRDKAGRLLGVLVSVHDLTDPAEVWRRYRAREVEGADAPEQAGGVAAARASGAPLTAREQAVLRLAADGLTNAQIAARLGISAQAVEKRLATAFRKLGVHARAAAVALALRQGWM